MKSSSSNYRRYLDPRTLAKAQALELRARNIVEGLLTGMHRSPYQGSSVEFAQHRQYVAGDDTRHLDWRVYGRSDRLYIKQFQEETNLPLMLVVDASQSMGFGSVAGRQQAPYGEVWTKFDHATSIAAILSYMAIRQQDSVGLAIFDQTLSRFFKPSNAPTQWKLVVEELTHVPKWNKTDTGKILDQVAEKLTHRSLIVVMSDFFDDLSSIKRGLRHLRYRKHEVIMLQVLDRQELTFPFEEITKFKGLEELGELLTEPRGLRDAYLEQLNAATDELKRICRGMGIDYTQFDTAEPLDAQLAGFLATRASTM
ncbi:MAG: DUF58 domain-containing protein [Tepidisphaeraceae bacterium]